MKFPKIVPAKNFPNYDVTNDGNIQNRKTGRILKPQLDRNGFKQVSLRKDKKQYTARVARVVADSFYEDSHPELTIDYKDGDKKNTAPDNLTFSTRGESYARAYDVGKKKYIPHVRVRIVETGKAYRSIRACAIALGDESYRYSIGKCLDNPNKSFRGYHYISLNK